MFLNCLNWPNNLKALLKGCRMAQKSYDTVAKFKKKIKYLLFSLWKWWKYFDTIVLCQNIFIILLINLTEQNTPPPHTPTEYSVGVWGGGVFCSVRLINKMMKIFWHRTIVSKYFHHFQRENNKYFIFFLNLATVSYDFCAIRQPFKRAFKLFGQFKQFKNIGESNVIKIINVYI